jgi:ABC-type Mn2+/Zn2+ transport system permease subunit
MISEDLATSKGINIPRTNLLYILLVSLIVAVGIRIVGTLLVGFLVIVPAAAAKNVSPNLSKYFTLSSIFGSVSAVTGVLIAGYYNLSAGPIVVFAGITIFGATVVLRSRMMR